MVRVTTAAEAAAIDARAIAAGTASFTLMSAAGRAAADVIRARLRPYLADGCIIFAGPGNNGGDAWIVARELAAATIAVILVEVEPPKTDDAQKAKSSVGAGVRVVPLAEVAVPAAGKQPVVVDGLLGTGASGAARGAVGEAIRVIRGWQTSGARVVALDVPSGVDATTGVAAGDSVRAELTVTFGTIKRGLLRNRAAAGAIAVVDIGLGGAPNADGLELIDSPSALAAVPPIGANAHKGTRRRLLVIGGATGMAGATVLAARSAMRSGIGMVRLCVEANSITAVQAAEPGAMASAWPADDTVLADYLSWPHCVLLGPGLGLSRAGRELATRVLTAWRGPVVVDADALTAFEGDVERLGELLKGRPAVITPHVVEAHRLAGLTAADIDTGRFESAALLAKRVRATVLLKGVPTVVSDGARTVVIAAGTPALATAGSGDVLAGIVATLLAQTSNPVSSAATAAWVHGRAAELAGPASVRGVTLEDVIASLRLAWRAPDAPKLPMIGSLPAVGEQA